MAKMQMESWVIVAIFLIAIGAIFYLTGNFPGAIPAGVTPGTPGGQVGGTGTCPLYESVVPGSQVVLSIKDNNNLETQVATTAAVYKKDSTVAEFSLTTSASAKVYGNSSLGQTLTCNDVYKEIVGDGTTYYYQDSIDGCYLCATPVKATAIPGLIDSPTYITASGAQTYGKYVVDKVGTFSLLMSNGNEFPVASLSENITMGDGEQYTSAYMRIKNTVTQSIIRTPIMCFDYNASAFDYMKVADGVKTSTPKTASAYEECWTTGIDYVKGVGYVDVPLVLTAKSGVNPINETVVIRVIDTATRISEGKLYEAYETVGGGTDIGSTDATFSLEID